MPLAAATGSSPAELATVNGDPVTTQELLDAFTARHGGHAKFLGGNGEAREFLNLLIDDRLFTQEAYNLGLDEEPAVQALIADYVKRNASGILIKSEIDDKVKPSEDEVKTAWKALNFFIHARQIVVETKQEAGEIRAAIVHGGDVDELARTCSLADSRSHGGHIIANWGQFEPEWERIVFALEPGEVSPVIETKNGYEVVIVDGRADVAPPALDKVRAQIESVLQQRKTEERKRAFSEELWKKYEVVVAPLDFSPAALARTLATAPETVVATWSGGGNLALKDLVSEGELRMFSKFSPVRARREIETRLRSTVNAPLVDLDVMQRKMGDAPELAPAVEKYRRSLIKKALFAEHVFKDVTVSDEDVRKFYDANKSDFIEPEQRHVAHVMVATEADAKSVREKLAAGADFDEIAKKSSRDFMTAGSGGDLGWINAGKVPAVFKEVLALGKGSLSKPIHGSNGWHIIKVLEIKPKRQQTLDEVKEKVTQRALESKQREAQTFWRDKLRAAAKIEIYDAAIRQFVADHQFTGEAPPQHQMK
jgi:parvulin-like peptidyl-prolyl isomerase